MTGEGNYLQAPEDKPRGVDVFDVPLGTVFEYTGQGKPGGRHAGTKWVYVGTLQSGYSAPSSMQFIMLGPAYHGRDRFTYHAAYADTLAERFPGLEAYRRK